MARYSSKLGVGMGARTVGSPWTVLPGEHCPHCPSCYERLYAMNRRTLKTKCLKFRDYTT